MLVSLLSTNDNTKEIIHFVIIKTQKARNEIAEKIWDRMELFSRNTGFCILFVDFDMKLIVWEFQNLMWSSIKIPLNI